MNGIALRVSTRWLPLSTSTTGVHRRDDVGISATNAKLLAICLWDTPKADAALAAVAKDPATSVVVHWECQEVSCIESVPVQTVHGRKQHAPCTWIAKKCTGSLPWTIDSTCVHRLSQGTATCKEPAGKQKSQHDIAEVMHVQQEHVAYKVNLPLMETI